MCINYDYIILSFYVKGGYVGNSKYRATLYLVNILYKYDLFPKENNQTGKSLGKQKSSCEDCYVIRFWHEIKNDKHDNV